MTYNDNSILPEMADQVEPVEEAKPDPRKFVPDYRYASTETITEITVAQLAKLEAELHTLRIVYFANGENPDLLVNANRTIGQEIENVMASLDRLTEYFEAVLED